MSVNAMKFVLDNELGLVLCGQTAFCFYIGAVMYKKKAVWVQD